jgi:23S rRNA (uridine2552-2'-O)-methyltransferase
VQVALARGAARVVGIDLLPIIPARGAEFIEGDFMAEGMEARLIELLGGPASLVLSDMAPNTTGHVATDHIRIMALADAALVFAVQVLEPGGSFVAKLFQGGADREMLNILKLRFRTVRHAKPPASRKDSKEMYIIATGFRS